MRIGNNPWENYSKAYLLLEAVKISNLQEEEIVGAISLVDLDNVVAAVAKEEVAFCAEEEEDAFCVTVTPPHADRAGCRIRIKDEILRISRGRCVERKQTRVSFGVGKQNTKGILDYVHTDVWGPSSTPSLSRGKYFVSFIDDFSHNLWVYVLKLKSNVFETFKTWLAQVEVETGKKLKVLRSDNSGEFTCGNFKDFYSSKGIHRHYTTPGDPQSNGVAEQINRTLLEKDKFDPRAIKGSLLEYTDDQLKFTLHIGQEEPLDIKEALASTHSSKWLGAMKEEIEALLKNST
ncbi:hypothetical protein OSB04_031718 [Centaurea solstitialis]|uniref:Integrase catalytic domain-containing protein n=1 Tax=Centaurea solstitialis TaxID=347529 RepID=A0AA38W505_9ASTR|nr:hypothetical protein OSB04_031718 [Centaurea solstitialis]